VEFNRAGQEPLCNVADTVKTHPVRLARVLSARENRPARLSLADELTERA
jgi:hypothetical protein